MAPGELRGLYRYHFRDAPRERLFLSSISFFLAFGFTRGIAHAIRAGIGPFHDLAVGQTHIHHLVWGILLLLVVGYGSLIQPGPGQGRLSVILSRLLAILYGIGAALTLDEFALWLHLEDVYWAREGRASVDAVVLFGALVSAGVWGGPFLKALGKEATLILRGRRRS